MTEGAAASEWAVWLAPLAYLVLDVLFAVLVIAAANLMARLLHLRHRNRPAG